MADIIVDLNSDPPLEWGHYLVDRGATWGDSEILPHADQIRLMDVAVPEGFVLPAWAQLTEAPDE